MLSWNENPVVITGEFREPKNGELFLELPDNIRPLRILECHPYFNPSKLGDRTDRIIVVLWKK